MGIKIGLLSDTHSHLDDSLLTHFTDCDEIWHAGDIGDLLVADRLEAIKPFRCVYGNIDDQEARLRFPEDLVFTINGLKVLMTHIGGYPGRYSTRARKLIEEHRPGLFICGHSHILKVMPDHKYQLLHMNPGAAGKHGFHQMKTALRFVISEGKVHDLEVIELGLRGALR